MANRTLVVIPAYNEATTIEEVVRGAIAYADVSVTDDASKDETASILKKLSKEFGKRLNVIRHEKNTHIPKGIQDGMKYAVEKKYDWVITMDAGLSHDANYLREFIEFPNCDLVIGSRTSTVNVPLYRKFISWLAAKVMNYCLSNGVFNLFGNRLRDCTSGYRRYSKPMFEKIANYPLESVAFDFHMEALSIVSKNNGSIQELPIKYVFSNSSFNRKVLKLAIQFAKKLLLRKWKLIPDYP
ncbi:glycosyltransferase, group 2 family protein [Leptospira yanagawae serovar Saopaulo str. Sao Paulo = ATCC 700523]|uniref:Glycosyltransferase, group 2 family protein n=1 Tax=Leptospira yanagawae serovar Saopaulo str. Sao Paulo = ATCC 700523 TaxID=1249483 RepID=A0A5E8H8D9_9LEPT|nr:glycosyltransferase family 2 protein [Leptospira yanagawae]EOQ87043.1 glycosyltransferase, group 2 family protein [Leptospira yanagawae serovar Saopaulo str. Sao Paulo = ATCC 700523]